MATAQVPQTGGIRLHRSCSALLAGRGTSAYLLEHGGWIIFLDDAHADFVRRLAVDATVSDFAVYEGVTPYVPVKERSWRLRHDTAAVLAPVRASEIGASDCPDTPIIPLPADPD